MFPIPKPFVSCIIPTYNRSHFVPRAIECFLQQDYEQKKLSDLPLDGAIVSLGPALFDGKIVSASGDPSLLGGVDQMQFPTLRSLCTSIAR